MKHFDEIELRKILEKLYNECNFKELILKDPIEFPHRYKSHLDIEVAGFIASSLAYGRVSLFKAIIEKILNIMGTSPYDFVVHYDQKKHEKFFTKIHYRFNSVEDIRSFLIVIQRTLIEYKSLENLFKKNFKEEDINIGKALSAFVDTFYKISANMNINSTSFKFLIPNPQKNSPCKRLNLFLRWMIRDKDVDFGIWKGITKDKLVIPLDTHISKISLCLGITRRKSQDWKTAVEITNTLKLIEPEDPLKYDLPLCHYGVSKLCNKKECKDCALKKI
ncbi:MAG: TIGR02757 family protein [Thermodesulfovibrionales bacterium]|nr:TIGR02757 family protein [Thermodesulfovibrionales bacterium]